MLISLFTNGDFATRSNDVEADGVEDISHEGSDGALFWSDAAATQPLSSLSGISLSSVTEESGGASHTFYMTSPNIGSGSFTALFTLLSGETRGVVKSYRAIEPIRKLVCSEIDPEYSCVFNPSRLVYGHPARLKVGVNGNFSPSDVEWSIVSGPGTVVRGEDDFGSADWTATVTATAESGEVVVEARFNEDAIQPRFVLPIVQQRTLPVEAYVICDSIRDVFETLLMYGYEGEFSLDIPSGTVHGLFEWSRNVLERKNVKVGAEDIKINMED